MLIGSTSLFGAASYYQGVNANAEKKSDTNNDTSNRSSSGLTKSQLFTQQHAGLSASDYISAYFDFAEQNSAELLKSGAATDTFSVRFEGRTYSLAGERLGALNFGAAKLSDALQVPVAKAPGAPKAPSAAVGNVNLIA